MSTDLKKIGGKIAIVAVGVVAVVIVFKLLGGIIRLAVSVAIVALIVFCIFKLIAKK